MKEETKTLSVRLPVSDYETLLSLASSLDCSISYMVKSVIHVGLIIAESTAQQVTKEVTREALENIVERQGSRK